jgi:hypothetical protein
VIRESYEEIARSDVCDRDHVALALARFLYRTQPAIAPGDVKALIEPMIHRLLSKELGGRSHSLAALMALLVTSEDQNMPASCLPSELATVAEHAVTAGDFVHAEFGLIVAAKLAEARSASSVGFLKHLLSIASGKSRTERFQRIASKLTNWTRDSGPLNRVLRRRMIGDAISRRTDMNQFVWDRQDDVQAVINRILAVGPAGVTSDELSLVDQWTRFRADRHLQHELGRYLF